MSDRVQGIFDPLTGLLDSIPLLNIEVAGNVVWLWLVALAGAALLYAVFRVVLSLLTSRLGRMAGRTPNFADDLVVGVLGSTGRVFLFAAALLAASMVLDLTGTAAVLRRWMVVVAGTLQVGFWGQRAITLWLEHQRDQRLEIDPGSVTTLQGLSYLARVILWSAVLLLMLDNLGYNVTTLLAGLGIGGVAVALALQNVLGDLFASLSIALDKPFVTGDFIIVDDMMGTVTYVGLKTTRVTSLSGEQLVFANSDLLASRIRNYKKMQERRVAFSIGVIYQTSVEHLEEIPDLIRRIIEETPETRFDRAHFKAFGDSAYVFETVYYVLSADYAVFMDCQQHINLELCRQFEERGVDFAYPTRTLHIAPQTGPALVVAGRDEALDQLPA